MKTSNLIRHVMANAVFAVFGALSLRADVPYIESDGVDDWIETGRKASAQTKIVCVAKTLATTTSDQYLFGSTKDASGVKMVLGVAAKHNNVRHFVWRCNDGASINTDTGIVHQDLLSRITMDLPGDKFAIENPDEGSVLYQCKISDVGGTRCQESAYKVAIFAQHRDETTASDFAKMRLYSFQWYEAGELVLDLLPYRSEDGDVVGLKDSITGVVYKNKGVGNFVYAEDAGGGLEEDLMKAILSVYDEVNPVVSGARKFISLAYIADTHKCKRTAGDTDPTNPVKDYWYHDDAGGPLLVDPEPTIRLLGKVAAEASFDGLVHAGDFSTAITQKPFGEGDYLAEIRNVKAMVMKHLPDTPFFAVDGNHDRDYWNDGRTSGHSMSDSEWAAALSEINTDVSGNASIVRTAGTGNSYALDFKRCLAVGGKNIRLVMVSIFDTNGGSDPKARMAEGLVFADSSVGPSNTFFGVTAHDYRDGLASAVIPYLAKHVGTGFFGAICGHRHSSTKETIAGTGADRIGVKNAFSAVGDMSRAAYRFSIFVFDTEANVMREICLAGGDNNAPILIDHPIEVSAGLEPAGGDEAERDLLAIEGDGNACLVTDFVLNPQTDKIVATLELPKAPNSHFVFAARHVDSSDERTAYALQLRADGYRFDYKKLGATKPVALETSVKYTFTAENNVLTWSGGEGAVAEKDESFVAAGGTLRFYSAEGSSNCGTFRLYSVQIYRSGSRIHDLRPYYLPDVGATLVDKVKNGNPIAVTKQGAGSFIPIESPQVPRKAKRLDWVQGDGKSGYFEIDGYRPDPQRDKMEAVVTLKDLSANVFVFSARANSASAYPNGAWSLQLRESTGLRYDYNKQGDPQNRTLAKDIRYVFTANANELTWSHGGGVSLPADPSFTETSGSLWLMRAAASSAFSSFRLHSFRVWRGGVLIHEFLPTRLPSGALRLMDYAEDPVCVTGHGRFWAGPEIPRTPGFALILR